MGTAGPYLSLQIDVLCTGTLICRSFPDKGPFGFTLPQPVVTHVLGIVVFRGGKHKHRTFLLVIFVGLDSFINAAKFKIYLVLVKSSIYTFFSLITYIILVVVKHIVNEHLINGYTLFSMFFYVSIPIA